MHPAQAAIREQHSAQSVRTTRVAADAKSAPSQPSPQPPRETDSNNIIQLYEMMLKAPPLPPPSPPRPAIAAPPPPQYTEPHSYSHVHHHGQAYAAPPQMVSYNYGARPHMHGHWLPFPPHATAHGSYHQYVDHMRPMPMAGYHQAFPAPPQPIAPGYHHQHPIATAPAQGYVNGHIHSHPPPQTNPHSHNGLQPVDPPARVNKHHINRQQQQPARPAPRVSTGPQQAQVPTPRADAPPSDQDRATPEMQPRPRYFSVCAGCRAVLEQPKTPVSHARCACCKLLRASQAQSMVHPKKGAFTVQLCELCLPNAVNQLEELAKTAEKLSMCSKCNKTYKESIALSENTTRQYPGLCPKCSLEADASKKYSCAQCNFKQPERLFSIALSAAKASSSLTMNRTMRCNACIQNKITCSGCGQTKPRFEFSMAQRDVWVKGFQRTSPSGALPVCFCSTCELKTLPDADCCSTLPCFYCKRDLPQRYFGRKHRKIPKKSCKTCQRNGFNRPEAKKSEQTVKPPLPTTKVPKLSPQQTAAALQEFNGLKRKRDDEGEEALSSREAERFSSLLKALEPEGDHHKYCLRSKKKQKQSRQAWKKHGK